MNLTELSDSIADQLEREAKRVKKEQLLAAEEYYKGYIQACEDFAGNLRQKEKVIKRGPSQEAGKPGLMPAI